MGDKMSLASSQVKSYDTETPPPLRTTDSFSTKEKAPFSWTNLAFIATVANLGSLLFGFDFGATSSLLSRIAEFQTGFDDDQYKYYVIVANSDTLIGLIAAGSSIGATITFLFLLFFGNRIPKNDEIMLSALLYFIGAFLESSSGDVTWRNDGCLYILISGRLLYGAGIALSFHSVPQYISEISPKIGRGSIGSLTEAMTVIGVCLGFLIGYYTGTGNGFIVTFRVGYIIALVMGVLAVFIPRSPQWLVQIGADDEEVLEALQFIRPTATLALVAELKESGEEGKADKKRWENKILLKLETAKKGLLNDLILSLPVELKVLIISRTLRRCLGLALILIFLQQFTGQGAILYYAGTIFGELCPNSTADCIIGFGAFKLLSVLIMVFVADSYGRRKFLMGGFSVMTLALTMVIFGLVYGLNTLALVGIYLSVVANEFSLATLLWVVLNEIFPQFVRSAAISIAVATLFAWSSVVVIIQPVMTAEFGLSSAFMLYASAALISVIMCYLLVPETRGVDLEVSYKLVNVRMDKAIRFWSSGSLKDIDSDDTKLDEANNSTELDSEESKMI
jgi:MFS family permease